MSVRSLPQASSARFAATVAAGYLAFGIGWILFSDRVLQAFIADPVRLNRIQSLKGVVFVVVTAAALFVTLRRTAAGRTRSLLYRAGQIADLGGMLGGSAPGTFAAWMKSRGKLGGQNKVPRIINDPELWGNLLGFISTRAR